MSRPFPPARPGTGPSRGPPLPGTPPPNIRPTSNQPTPSRTTTNTIPIPPRPVTPTRGSGVIPARGGVPSRTPPSTPPRGGSGQGGFNGAATAPPVRSSWKTTSNGPPLPSTPPPVLAPGRITSPRSPARPPPSTQTPGPTEQKQKRLSVSLHTDRQNVAAVVDLPINNEAVQEREVPPTPPTRGGFNGSTTAPPIRTPPPSSSPRRDTPLPSTEQYPSSPGPIRPPPRPVSRMAKPGPPLSPQNSSEALLQRQPSGGSLNSPDSSDRQERLRQEALKEIVNTERDYVLHLELVSEVFLRPLKEQPKVISPQELATLFSNWELLVGVNQEILNNFDKDPSNIMIGRTFLEMMHYLKMYKIYCASQPAALKVLETLQRDNSAFVSFLQDCLANPKCKGQNLFSYLIKPIQRLCKYPLLIKVLLEHTNPSHPDYQNLTTALREIEDIVTYVNEGKRQAEKSQKIIDLAVATEGGESMGLVTPTRALEMEQNIQVIIKKGKPQQRKCMLFNDAVLLLKEAKKGAKMYKNPKLMSLGDIKVVNVSDTAEFSHGIELQYSSTKEKYVLIFATEEDKQKWLRDIKRIVKLYQQKKFEEMKKEEEEREAAAKNQPPPAALSPPAGKRGSAIELGTSAPIQTRRATSYIVKETSTLIGNDSAPSPTTSKMNLLKRRSSFNNKTQISVIKPMQPAATPPPVKYGSKPVLKGK